MNAAQSSTESPDEVTVTRSSKTTTQKNNTSVSLTKSHLNSLSYFSHVKFSQSSTQQPWHIVGMQMDRPPNITLIDLNYLN